MRGEAAYGNLATKGGVAEGGDLKGWQVKPGSWESLARKRLQRSITIPQINLTDMGR